MREARQEGVAAGGVDDDEVALLRQAAEAFLEVLGLFGFGGVEVAGLAGVDADHFRDRQRRAGVANPAGAVFEIASERALADVEIHDPDLHAHAQKADAEVHGDGGFAGPALFVADDNGVRQPRATGCVRSSVGSCHHRRNHKLYQAARIGAATRAGPAMADSSTQRALTALSFEMRPSSRMRVSIRS